MADGRQLIEETYTLVAEVSHRLPGLKGTFSEEALSELRESIDLSLKWAKLCRNKVWLRTREGTDLAEACLQSARQLESNLGNPTAANDVGVDLSVRLESLARTISTQAQVIT